MIKLVRFSIFPLRISVLLLFFVFVFLFPAAAEAQNLVGGSPNLSPNAGLGEYIQRLYTIGFAAVGVTGLFAIILGGLQYTVSAGNPSKIEDAKDRILSAIYGIILLLLSFVILNTINPRIIALTAPPGQGGFDPSNTNTYTMP